MTRKQFVQRASIVVSQSKQYPSTAQSAKNWLTLACIMAKKNGDSNLASSLQYGINQVNHWMQKCATE